MQAQIIVDRFLFHSKYSKELKLRAIDCLVLCVIGSRLGSHEQWKMTIGEISSDSRLSRWTVKESIKRLENLSLIARKKTNGQNSIYSLGDKLLNNFNKFEQIPNKTPGRETTGLSGLGGRDNQGVVGRQPGGGVSDNHPRLGDNPLLINTILTPTNTKLTPASGGLFFEHRSSEGRSSDKPVQLKDLLRSKSDHVDDFDYELFYRAQNQLYGKKIFKHPVKILSTDGGMMDDMYREIYALMQKLETHDDKQTNGRAN